MFDNPDPYDYRDIPTLRPTEECNICTAPGELECDTCGQFFCQDHGYRVRDREHPAVIREQICELCQTLKMTTNPTNLLLRAADHQLEDPFDASQADAIQQRFLDGIRYGVWTWQKEAA